MSTPESTLYDNDSSTRSYDSSDDAKTRPLNVVDTDTDRDRDDSDLDSPNKAEASYLRHDAKNEVNTRWQEVQTEFVDDPRKSVAHAHQLVSDAVQRIVDTFTEERNQLERQWSEGGDVSTEELRVCLQRYREFFTRLLPLDGTRAQS